MAYRFGHAVGGAISIAAGVTSIAKNAMAADSARESGNIGRAAMYGVMAALDTVSVVLDGVSIVLDFIPGIGNAVSFVVDIVNTLVNVVGMVLGFFADMIDTRTPQQKLQGALDEYCESAAFMQFMDKQAKFYKDQGYDVFQYIVDAKAAELSEQGADGTKADKTITRRLSENARRDVDNRELRIALIDGSSIGRELRGRLGDDIIRAGVGDDEVFGDAGDDLLFGEGGNDTMHGGPGNDYLHGGTGRDRLFGDAGDDLITIVPGITAEVDGGIGCDTVSILPIFEQLTTSGIGGSGRVPSGIKSCYVDISTGDGRAGVALGSLICGPSSLQPHIHYAAFDSGSAGALKSSLVSKFSSSQTVSESLSNKYLWYLAEVTGQDNFKIFTDGSNLYAVGRRNGVDGTWKRANFIPNIRESEVISIDADTNNATCRNNKELEAWFFLAFKGTEKVAGIERVAVSVGSSISAQVVGNSENNIIDVGSGADAIVFTGAGNNVVSLQGTPALEKGRYLLGGAGQNTLVINRDRHLSNNYVLMDLDLDMNNANKDGSPNLWSGNSVEGAIYMRNFKTVQCNFKSGGNFCRIDASNLNENSTFIVDGGSRFTIIGSQQDNAFYLKSTAMRARCEVRGFHGKNYLSLENFAVQQYLGIDLEQADSIYALYPTIVGSDGYVLGHSKSTEVTVELTDIASIRGNHMVLEMKGHPYQDNLLVVNGGSCTVEARGGSNTIVCMRGRHHVYGGNGSEAYVIHGPRTQEQIMITVARVETPGVAGQDSGIKATSIPYGFWDWVNHELTLKITEYDRSSVELTSIHIVDSNGNVLSNKGTVHLSGDKRSAVFRPQSYFNGLKVNASETIRVKFETKGSNVVVHEPNYGNRIEFKTLQDGDVHLGINSTTKALEIRNSTNELIMTDAMWGRNFGKGMSGINDLCYDFAKRFIELKFTNTEVKGKEVFKLLWSKLTYLVKGLNEYDNVVDARSLPSPVNLGSGDNVLFARRSKTIYITGDGSDIIDATTFDAPTPGTAAQTKIVTGMGDDLVAVGRSQETVNIQFALDGETEVMGNKILVLKDMEVNAFRVSKVQNNGGWQFGENPPFLSFDFPPSLIIFDISEEVQSDFSGETIVVNNVEEFLDRRWSSSEYWKYRMVFNSDGELYIRAPYTYYFDNLRLKINVEGALPEVEIRDHYEIFYKFKMDLAFNKAIRAGEVADAILQHVRAGFKLRRSTLRDGDLRAEIISLFSRRQYEIVGAAPEADVIAESNTTVSSASGKRILQIEADVTNVVIDSWGLYFLLLLGRSADAVKFTGLNGQAPVSGSGHRELWSGAQLICTMSSAPQTIVFRASETGNYEFILDTDKYLQESLSNSYVQRLFATPNQVMFLDCSDMNSTEVTIEISSSILWSRYFMYTFGALKRGAKEVFRICPRSNHGTTTAEEWQLQNDAQSQGLEFARHLPGGIRYRDRTVPVGEVTHIFAVAVKAQVMGGRPYNKTLGDDLQKTQIYLQEENNRKYTYLFEYMRKIARCIDVIV